MPRTTRKKRRRGRGIGTWAKKGLSMVRSAAKTPIGRAGTSYLTSKLLNKIKDPRAKIIAKHAISYGIQRLTGSGKRRGRGTTRSGGCTLTKCNPPPGMLGSTRGMGLTRAGNGLRLAGMGRRRR